MCDILYYILYYRYLHYILHYTIHYVTWYSIYYIHWYTTYIKYYISVLWGKGEDIFMWDKHVMQTTTKKKNNTWTTCTAVNSPATFTPRNMVGVSGDMGSWGIIAHGLHVICCILLVIDSRLYLRCYMLDVKWSMLDTLYYM